MWLCSISLGCGSGIYSPCCGARQIFAHKLLDFSIAATSSPHDLRVIALRQFVVTRKNYRAYAFPLFFRPLHEFLLASSSTRRACNNSPTSNARRAHNPKSQNLNHTIATKKHQPFG